jgi:hypothetical protein
MNGYAQGYMWKESAENDWVPHHILSTAPPHLLKTPQGKGKGVLGRLNKYNPRINGLNNGIQTAKQTVGLAGDIMDTLRRMDRAYGLKRRISEVIVDPMRALPRQNPIRK